MHLKKILSLFYFLFSSLLLFTSAHAQAQIPPEKNLRLQTVPATRSRPKAKMPELKSLPKKMVRPNGTLTKNLKADVVPKLKPNQYALRSDSITKIFAAQLYEGLLLSTGCFKGKKPSCMAYSKSLVKPAEKPEEKALTPYHTNFAAIHCGLIGGVDRIVKTYEGHDSDFCEFSDGSMVSSWSAYYKTNPQNISPQKK